MPTPLLSARGALVAAAGALAALAAMAGLTAARADSFLAREAMQGQETMATRDPAAFCFGAPGGAADANRTIRVKANDPSVSIRLPGGEGQREARFVVTNASTSETEREFTRRRAGAAAAILNMLSPAVASWRARVESLSGTVLEVHSPDRSG